MKMKKCFGVWCLAAWLAVPAGLAAKGPEEAATRLARPAIRQAEASVLRGNQRVRLDTGVPVAVYGATFQATPDTPRGMAAQYLKAHRDLLGLARADLSDLRHRSTRQSAAGSTVRLDQVVGGIPVYGAQIAITFDPRNRVTFVMNGYEPGVSGVSTTPEIPGSQALAKARGYLGVKGEPAYQRVRLVIYPEGEGARLAYEVRLVTEELVGDWQVLVDAVSGEIFRAADVALYAPADGTGNIFDPDPLSSAGASYGDTGFTDGSDADTSQLTGQLFNVTLRDIDLTGGTYSLVGPWAEIGDFENPKKGTFSQASSAFLFTREQDGFEAVNTYYHIDNMMRYINLTLGLNIRPYQYPGGVQFDPHGLSGSDNSHYITSSGRLAFGEGGVDDAEDADVVIHELGHGIHDWVTGGSLSQTEGLSEGFGDYLAASYSRSLGQWTPADPQYDWVFDWDGHNPFWGGRVTNWTDTRTYPQDLTGSIHTDGQFWSSCNLQIWDALGREKIDKAMFEGLGMTNSSTNQQDAAQAVLQAAINLGYSAADIQTMESVYQGCGYSVSSSVCGNGIREGSEECDGADLGGAVCGDQGCSGGSVSCTAGCTLDYSACTGCPQCDFDGVCDLGEDCTGCPSDCVGGTASAACGNGVCEAGDGENCVNCPADCNGVQNGNPNNRFCCGDGGGINPIPCGDSRCTAGGLSCTTLPGTSVTYCCGDLVCEGAETSDNCAVDCGGGGCTGGQPGDPCTDDAQCCSGKCRGPSGNQTCR